MRGVPRPRFLLLRTLPHRAAPHRPAPHWSVRPRSVRHRSLLHRFLLPGAALVAAATAAGCTSASSATSAGISNSAPKLQVQYEQVVRDVLPSVVQISSDNSTGSGVVYDGDGDIITNEHVVGSATTLKVQEAVGSMTLMAKVVGEFAPDDLAVIRVTSDASGLKPARFANSNDAQIGEIVLAMGNPLGLTDSVTQGIISATGRTVGADEASGGQALITAAIQTSAAINPGNSGGALVDLNGQVIGIPTLAATLPGQGGAAPGIGFAIPSDTAQNIAAQLIKHGKVTNSDRASLGITAQTAASESGEAIGVAVIAVSKDSTAADAGVKGGDTIVGINDIRIASLQELEGTLTELKPGTTVTIRYTRGTSTVHQGRAKLDSLGS
jgi:putative serine protease PepD